MKVDEWTSEDVYTLVGGEFLKLICAADVDNTIVSLGEMPKFEKEQ